MLLRLLVGTLLICGMDEANAVEGLLELTSGPSSCAASWIGEEGEVVTAYHCVISRRMVVLRDAHGNEWRAKVLATNRFLDLAYLRVEDAQNRVGLQVRHAPLKVGEATVVWGHPMASQAAGVPALEGLLAYSRFQGPVSAVGTSLVQLDVAFNPGISGGPVLDADGQIAAVASRKLRGEHLSFAAPLSQFWVTRHHEGRHVFSGHLDARVDLEIPLHVGELPSVHLSPQLVLWDWLVLEAAAGVGLGVTRSLVEREGAQWRSSRLGVLSRFRIGRGAHSVALDIGGHLTIDKQIVQGEVGGVRRFEEATADPHWGLLFQGSWKGWTFGGAWSGSEAQPSGSVHLGRTLANNLILF